MKLFERIEVLKKDKKATAAMLLGLGGLFLILLSSFHTDKKSESGSPEKQENVSECSYDDFCHDTEKRLEDFLRSIDGVGDVKVYLSVGTEERYVYAKEKKQSSSENKKEEDESYVIVGKGSEKNALVETVQTPEITGAVIACTGCGSPVVAERIYNSVSAALGIPSGKIYVTKLEIQQ